jgi:hypothetical protein
VREDVRDDSILAGVVWVTGSLPSVPRVAEKRDQRLVVNAPQRLVGMLVGLDEARTCTRQRVADRLGSLGHLVSRKADADPDLASRLMESMVVRLDNG